jgi:hypothetical protein
MTSMPAQPCSTADLGRRSDGRHPPKHSTSTWVCCNKPVLLRSIEFSKYASWTLDHQSRETASSDRWFASPRRSTTR